MKILLTISFLSLLLFTFISCQNRPVKIVFVSNKIDSATGINVTKIYWLKKQTTNSDFDYSKLNNLDKYLGDTLKPKLAFEPVNGHYNYYQFISTFRGQSYRGVDLDFHDILIIKTDNRNEIIDAYQYTLEWAEEPVQYDLFKSSSKGLTLVDSLKIDTFKFIRTEYSEGEDKFHREGGLVRLK